MARSGVHREELCSCKGLNPAPARDTQASLLLSPSPGAKHPSPTQEARLGENKARVRVLLVCVCHTHKNMIQNTENDPRIINFMLHHNFFLLDIIFSTIKKPWTPNSAEIATAIGPARSYPETLNI